VKQETARRLEQQCLQLIREFDSSGLGMEPLLSALREYEELYDPDKNHDAAYAETLQDRPWKQCSCDICRKLGYHVILFRGAERNRRRGFHNTWTFYRRLHRELNLPGLDEGGKSSNQRVGNTAVTTGGWTHDSVR